MHRLMYGGALEHGRIAGAHPWVREPLEPMGSLAVSIGGRGVVCRYVFVGIYI